MSNPVQAWLERRLTAPASGFGPASAEERIVYGARRPGYPMPRVSVPTVARWLEFMKGQGIERVVCLLPDEQLASYDDLLGQYRATFSADNLCWAPIPDFRLAEEGLLTGTILPFLRASEAAQQRVAVHCAGGIGRTGHVLAAWLVHARGMSNEAAIATVKQAGRNARESGDPRLDALLDACRASGTKQKEDSL